MRRAVTVDQSEARAMDQEFRELQNVEEMQLASRISLQYLGFWLLSY
jgi:hypothetical protein